MSSTHFDVILVGGGIAGSAAALRTAQYHHLRALWILGDKQTAKRSRGQWVANIDNMVGIHDGIVRKKATKILRAKKFAEARAVLEARGRESISTRDIIESTIERIGEEYVDQVTMLGATATGARLRDDARGFVVTADDTEYESRYLVLATGVMDRQPHIKKQRGKVVVDDPRWIYPFANRESVLYCIRCEGHLTRGTKTAVIGQSESAAQLALMLHERYESASCVLTNGQPPEWRERTGRLLTAYAIDVHSERIVDVAGERGTLHVLRLDGGMEIAVRFALISLGLHRVYNGLARALGADLEASELPEDERHVLIEHNGATSIPGLFAIGDMTKRRDGEVVMKQVYTAQEYAVRAIDSIDGAIRSARRHAILGEPAPF